jgi:hypothetical protein
LRVAETFYQQLTNLFIGSYGFYSFRRKCRRAEKAAPPPSLLPRNRRKAGAKAAP